MNACAGASWAGMRGGAVLAALLWLSGCAELWRWEKPIQRPQSGSARSARSLAGDAPAQYTVQKGDTLYSIAFRQQLDFHDVASWNGIGRDYLIHPGQVLRLRAPGAAAASSSVPRPRDVQPPPVASAPPAARPAQKPSIAERPFVSQTYYDWQWPLRGAVQKSYAAEDGGSKGVDISGELGQAVIAAAPGRVVYSGSGLKGYGELVIVKHDDTYLSAYGYNRKRLVVEGDLVTAGQAIAELGLGPEQKPMLHFEIRQRGKPVDPLRLLPPG